MHKTKDRVTRISLKTGGELMCMGRVSSFCSTRGTRRVNLVTNPVISHECLYFKSFASHRYRKIFTIGDLSVGKKVGKYYVVIQNAMHF